MEAIYFDMDGTIADLYSVSDWLPKLRNQDVTPYLEATPLVDMDSLNHLLEQFKSVGIEIGVISWAAGGDITKQYAAAIRGAKMAWLYAHLPIASEIHIVKYGTPKHRVAKRKNSILVDDNQEVCEAWQRSGNGSIILAEDSSHMMEQLYQLAKAI